jgi:predicted tellurium resistance membrane protein TerC
MVMKLLHKYPIFVYLGAGILGYTAGEMFVSEDKVMEYFHYEALHWIIPIVTTIIVLAAGAIKKLMSSKASE